MGFSDSMDERFDAASREEDAKRIAEAAYAAEVARLTVGFIAQFQEATDYLTSKGVRPSRVVSIRREGMRNWPTLERVYPYSALEIGGFYLHGGELHRGHEEQANTRSLMHGLRKRDLVVNTRAGGPAWLGLSTGHEPAGVPAGSLCVVKGGVERDSYYAADQWLMDETAAALERHRRSEQLRR